MNAIVDAPADNPRRGAAGEGDTGGSCSIGGCQGSAGAVSFAAEAGRRAPLATPQSILRTLPLRLTPAVRRHGIRFTGV